MVIRETHLEAQNSAYVSGAHLLLIVSLLCACPRSKSDTYGCDRTWYEDADGDGFGNPMVSLGESCESPAGAVSNGEDCDDNRADVHPSAPEVCDELDNDCDGVLDEDLDSWYPDADDDGYGGASSKASCVFKPGMLSTHNDCDDQDASVHPGGEDLICDGIDSDCNGTGAGAIAFMDSVEYADAQEAIDAAPESATVFFCPGTHVVGLNVAGGRTIALDSYSGSAKDTILSGAGEHRLFTIAEGASVAIGNLTFENGHARRGSEDGGAIELLNADLAVTDCLFRWNWSGRYGGAVSGAGWDGNPHSLSLIRTEFVENVATQGGAIAANGLADSVATDVTISQCDFSENRSAWGGGALDLSVPVVSVSSSSFVDNHGWRGGAMRVDASVSAGVVGSTFTDNTAVQGGAISGKRLEIIESVFERNEATSGGVLFAEGSTEELVSILIQDTSFCENTARYGSVIEMSAETVRLEATQTEFVGNDASGVEGPGVIWLHGTLSGEFESVEAVFEASTFVGNHADQNTLGEIQDFTSTEVTFQGCTLRENEAMTGVAGFYFTSVDKPDRTKGATLDVQFVGTTIEENVALRGTGLLAIETVAEVMSLSFLAGSVKDNYSGSLNLYTVRIPDSLVLTSDGTDWGEGDDDNIPCDLVLAESVWATEAPYCDRGSASFTCPGDGTCTE